MRHPEHERLAGEMGEWYTRSRPEMGYRVERRRFGFYQWHEGAGRARVTVRDVSPEEVPDLVEDVRGYYGGCKVRLLVDDRELDGRLGPALVEAGCVPEVAEVFLAHVGDAPEVRTPEGVSVEPVGEENIYEHVETAIRGFASSEETPGQEEIDSRMALRRAEMAGDGRFLLARAGGEPAAVLGFYEGEDRFVFNLATRKPYRGRGIATRLLAGILEESKEKRCSAEIINAEEDGEPVGMYRRLGFTDEMYWRRKYRLPEGSR